MIWGQIAALGLAVVVQIAALAYWAGRVSARIDGVDRRLAVIERRLDQPANRQPAPRLPEVA